MAQVQEAVPTVPERRVTSPVFVLSSIRSGSTLLRVLLNSHSEIYAPHELHLGAVRVHLERDFAKTSIEALGLDKTELDFLLWDQLLYRQLQSSGKKIIVEKTPGNAFMWSTLAACWPQAKFIFLLRHPVSVVESYRDRREEERPLDRAIKHLNGYFNGVEAARASVPGLTVRYEELTAEPERVTRSICDHLGVRWERSMLDYGDHDHGRFRGGIGDWSSRIRSGRIQPARPLPAPEDVPEGLREIAGAWGYLDG